MLLQKIKTYFFQNKLQKQRAAQNTLRASKHIDDIKQIGFIFLVGDIDQQEVIFRYAESLRKKGKTVKLLGFINHKNEHDNYDFKYFSIKNCNWYGLPVGSDVEQFIETPFDLLINFCGMDIPQFEYVMRLSKASFRVGKYTEKTDCYDLMLDTHENTDVSFFIGQVNFFLKILNKKQHEAVASV